jgi:hypothetical protein
MLTWLMVGAADSVRLGRLTAGAAQRHLSATLASALLRPGEMFSGTSQPDMR